MRTHPPVIRMLSWLVVALVPAAIVFVVVVTTAAAIAEAPPAVGASANAGVALLAVLVFAFGSAPVWASGLHQLVLTVASGARRVEAASDGPTPTDPTPAASPRRIAVVMCTADDFSAERARECAAQDVEVDLVVLDDSATAEGRARVDAFARAYRVRVIRRTQRTGFKGGNVSHALGVLGDAYSHWLLVDSDQSLAPDAARRLASHLASGVAIVQGRPVPRAWGSRFARVLGGLPATHLALSQRGRPSPWFLGRVALIDVAALRAVGGMPGRVIEDVALTVRVRAAGLRIVDAPDVVADEDAPVDARAFRVQQLKFLEGAIELVRRDGRLIATAPFPLVERIEILLAHALVPAAIAGGALAVLSGAVLAAFGVFPVWAGLVTGAAGLAPLAGELARLLRARRSGAALRAAVVLPALYGSLLVAATCSLIRVLGGGRARFRVTPKTPTASGIVGTVAALRAEIVTALVAIAVATLAGMPLLATPFVAPFALGFAFGMLERGPRAQRTIASNSPSATRMLTSSPAVAAAAARMMPPSARRTTA